MTNHPQPLRNPETPSGTFAPSGNCCTAPHAGASDPSKRSTHPSVANATQVLPNFEPRIGLAQTQELDSSIN